MIILGPDGTDAPAGGRSSVYSAIFADDASICFVDPDCSTPTVRMVFLIDLLLVENYPTQNSVRYRSSKAM